MRDVVTIICALYSIGCSFIGEHYILPAMMHDNDIIYIYAAKMVAYFIRRAGREYDAYLLPGYNSMLLHDLSAALPTAVQKNKCQRKGQVQYIGLE